MRSLSRDLLCLIIVRGRIVSAEPLGESIKVRFIYFGKRFDWISLGRPEMSATLFARPARIPAKAGTPIAAVPRFRGETAAARIASVSPVLCAPQLQSTRRPIRRPSTRLLTVPLPASPALGRREEHRAIAQRPLLT
jgi:hypothetical protein